MSQEYKTKHLFLLVGENPLPNYIAARTLLEEGGTVYLVFTKGTVNQKDSLKRELKNITTQLIDLSNQESNANKIRQRIGEKVNKIDESESIGLNYTGGTKAMAVHAYQRVKELRNDAIFSYLDARRLKMCIDQENNEPILIDLDLQISLEELFNLHELYLLKDSPPSSVPILQELAEEILKVHKQKGIDKDWKNWVSKPIGNTKNLRWCELFPNLKTMLNHYLDLTEDSPKITGLVKEVGFTKFEDFKKWLQGTWLESYVLKAIQDKSERLGITPENSMMSFDVTDKSNPVNTKNKNDDAKFEFDIAFIKGYQLFAISCTNQSKDSACKEKLFEAYLRAKELGGDEARVALVSCNDDPRKIQQELKRFGFEDIKIRVFGRADLEDIGSKIVNWVCEVERRAQNP
jgi:hypothetical protein